MRLLLCATLGGLALIALGLTGVPYIARPGDWLRPALGISAVFGGALTVLIGLAYGLFLLLARVSRQSD